MQSMINFTLWFLQNLPDFLLSEPICYVWGLILLAYIINLFLRFKH